MGRSSEVRRHQVRGDKGAGLDVGVFAVAEKSEGANDQNQGGGVGKVGLAFETSGAA